jgi:hypothetical protein
MSLIVYVLSLWMHRCTKVSNQCSSSLKLDQGRRKRVWHRFSCNYVTFFAIPPGYFVSSADRIFSSLILAAPLSLYRISAYFASTHFMRMIYTVYVYFLYEKQWKVKAMWLNYGFKLKNVNYSYTHEKN